MTEKVIQSSEEKVEALGATFTTDGWRYIIKPALVAAIDGINLMWVNGTRAKGEENITDNELKQRAFGLHWVLGWERNRENLVKQLEELRQVREATEPGTEGGSPYV